LKSPIQSNRRRIQSSSSLLPPTSSPNILYLSAFCFNPPLHSLPIQILTIFFPGPTNLQLPPYYTIITTVSMDPPPASEGIQNVDMAEAGDAPAERRESISQRSEDSQTAADFIRDQMQLEADAREALPYVRSSILFLLHATYKILTVSPTYRALRTVPNNLVLYDRMSSPASHAIPLQLTPYMAPSILRASAIPVQSNATASTS
jgi:hypothetical protein